MSAVAEVKGVKEIVAKLRKMAAEILDAKGKQLMGAPGTDKRVSVIVGYETAYALHVHENIEMKWRGLPRDRSVRVQGPNANDRIAVTGFAPGAGKGLYWGPHGQAKFLEQPFREMSAELSRIVVAAFQKTKNILTSLLLAGLRLQRESQELVPIEFGVLKASAFTREEK